MTEVRDEKQATPPPAPDTGGYVPPGKRARLGRSVRADGAVATARTGMAWAAGYACGLPRTFTSSRATFTFDDEEYPYLVHRHRWTWLSERAVEVPIAARAVGRAAGRRVLEVGHVLGHYGVAGHEVVDRWERVAGVRNADVMDLAGSGPYDLIVSVSTLEHVGWDETPRHPGRAAEAIALLVGELAPGGRLLVTLPAGYHPVLDAALAARTLPFDQILALGRTGPSISWAQVTLDAALATPYDELLFRAGAVVVASGGPTTVARR